MRKFHNNQTLMSILKNKQNEYVVLEIPFFAFFFYFSFIYLFLSDCSETCTNFVNTKTMLDSWYIFQFNGSFFLIKKHINKQIYSTRHKTQKVRNCI